MPSYRPRLIQYKPMAACISTRRRISGGKIVQRLLKAGPVAIVILGGSHDLGPEIRRENLRVEYRVVGYRAMAKL